MHVYKELSFVGNKPGLDSLAKNIYTVFPMNWIKPERNHDGAVLSSSDVDIRREDRKRLEENTVAKR